MSNEFGRYHGLIDEARRNRDVRARRSAAYMGDHFTPKRSWRSWVRGVRRWLGFGCKVTPWANAVRTFQCELSKTHKGAHTTETSAGPITWRGDDKWYMPPVAPFVTKPREREFTLWTFHPQEDDATTYQRLK